VISSIIFFFFLSGGSLLLFLFLELVETLPSHMIILSIMNI